jgi:hypothetical protein
VRSIRRLSVGEVWQVVKLRPNIGIRATVSQVRAGLAERAARQRTAPFPPSFRRLGREAAAGLGLTTAHAALFVGVTVAVSGLAALRPDIGTGVAVGVAAIVFGLRLIVTRFNPGDFIDDTVFEDGPGIEPGPDFDPTDFEEPTAHGYFAPVPHADTHHTTESETPHV